MVARALRHSGLIAALAFSSLGCAADSSSICKAPPGAPQEIAATPRQDAHLELLALRLSDGITAEEAVYQRLARDVGAIRVEFPAVRDIKYFAPYSGTGINVTLDEPSLAKLQAGEYQAWDCLNRHFGVAEISPPSETMVTLTFKGRFKLEQVAAAYKSIAGVADAEPVTALGDGPTISVAQDESSTWRYVFDNKSGDCMSGCMVHDAYYFGVTEDGKPTLLGRWQSSSAGEPKPDWVDRYLMSKN